MVVRAGGEGLGLSFGDGAFGGWRLGFRGWLLSGLFWG